MTLDAASAFALAELGYDPDDPHLEERLVNEQADDLEWLSRIERTYPLAQSVLWRNDLVPWDQRRATLAALTSPIVTVVLGGERSGKSVGLKQATVAQALGGDHPAVRSWLELNDFPLDIIPDGPARVYALALDSNASARYHRPDFDQLIGTTKFWSNQTGKGEAKLYIPVPGHDRMAEIWFKGVDQGPDAMQGDSIRWWWVDEEPKTEKGRLVFGQLKARVMDQCGRGAITMVPMSGYTWVHDDLIRDQLDEVVVARLNALDNPHLPVERAASHFAAMSDEERAVRQFGEFRSRSGSIYPTFADGDGTREGTAHTCDPFDIPADWPRFRGADFGLVNPTCVLWGAIGDDDTLYIYREYYEPDGESYRWHGEQVLGLEPDDDVVQGSWGDPAAKDALDDWATMDLYFDRANNAVKFGIDAVKDRLRLRGDFRPRLKVFRTCTNLIREMRGYVWDPQRKDEQPLKKDDHSPDALRYLCTGLIEYRGL